jgi:hypothetical protein
MFPGALIVILNFLLLVNARVVGYVLFWTFEFVRTRVLDFVARQIEFPWKLQYDLQRQVEGAWCATGVQSQLLPKIGIGCNICQAEDSKFDIERYGIEFGRVFIYSTVLVQ